MSEFCSSARTEFCAEFAIVRRINNKQEIFTDFVRNIALSW